MTDQITTMQLYSRKQSTAIIELTRAIHSNAESPQNAISSTNFTWSIWNIQLTSLTVLNTNGLVDTFPVLFTVIQKTWMTI